MYFLRNEQDTLPQWSLTQSSSMIKVSIYSLKNGSFQVSYTHPEDHKRRRKAFTKLKDAQYW